MEIIILGVILIFPLSYILVQYNGLVVLRNHIRESWSDIDTELKRRHDLIPNLVSVVKGYAAHEREVLERVVELRNQSLTLQGPSALGPVEHKIDHALQRIIALAENYPVLKADAHFLSLQKELANTENRIQAARRFYNANVRDYLNKCEMFPSSMVASFFGFRPETYFTADSQVREVPEVNIP
ncbi:MAG: LemA family protein [Puniceicoccales bacterium]|jgi:LemA protein|nr:LemA family protein [Puniceicoccales bacterium]